MYSFLKGMLVIREIVILFINLPYFLVVILIMYKYCINKTATVDYAFFLDLRVNSST